jgi:hypothetical protein
MKLETWVLISCLAVALIIGGVCGWTINGWTHKQQPPVIVSGPTVNLTQAQRDSLDAEWRKKFVIVHKGKSVSKGKTDTIYTTTEDSTTIQGLYSLIEAMSENTATIDNPYPGQLTPAQSKPRLGLGLALGAEYFTIDGSVRPILQVPVRWKNWYLIGGCGWEKQLVPNRYQLAVGLGF